jgi:hypothetical protein
MAEFASIFNLLRGAMAQRGYGRFLQLTTLRQMI